MQGIEISGSVRDDDLVGSQGDDLINGAGGVDVVLGLEGDDKLLSGLVYDAASATYVQDKDGDFLDGGPGNDLVQGSLGNDRLIGGTGDDQLYGGGGKDSLQGGEGNDILQSGKAYDPATKGFNADIVGDTLEGGDGNDQLFGEDGHDLLAGGAGDDLLAGLAGNDLLLGGTGHDRLFGEDGNDTLDGGSGANQLLGGAGDDVYYVRSAMDQVWDESGNDRGMIFADWVLPTGSIENWTWAPGVQKLPNWIAALAVLAPVGSITGITRIVDYHFAAQPADFFSDTDKKGFEPFNDAQRAAVRKVFDYVSTVLNVEFRETDKVDSKALVLANNQQDDSSGYASSRLLMLNAGLSENLAPTVANFGVEVLLHELGHSLGLKHPFAYADALGKTGAGPYLSSTEDSSEHTVMTYNHSADNLDLAYSALDLAALHYIHGPSAQLAAGDTIWSLNTAAANFIADGAGNDTVDGSAASDSTGGITVDLRPGYWGFLGAKADSIVAAGQATVNFGTLVENLRGGAGNDSLTGNEIANRIDGGAGKDVLTGGAGSDLLDGGLGLDVAVYAGTRAGYKISLGKDGGTVLDLARPADVDTLGGIERLKFDDAMLGFDVDGVAGQAYRLYQAAFDRTPDMAGLGYWISRMDAGASLNDVASAFIASSEFTAMYGAKPANGGFLTRIYQNILHRAPDQAGFDYWLKAMDQGSSATDILAQFSQSHENVVALAGVLQDGIAYTPYG